MQNTNSRTYIISQKVHFTTRSGWEYYQLLPVRWDNSFTLYVSASPCLSLSVTVCVCGIIYSLIITQPVLCTIRQIEKPCFILAVSIITNTNGEQGSAGSAGTFNFQTAIVIMNCFLPVFSRSFSLDRYSVSRHMSGCEKMGVLVFVKNVV